MPSTPCSGARICKANIVKPLLVVDGNWLCCAKWWANASNVQERFRTAVEKILPTDGGVVVAWDDPRGSWRRDILPTYKSGRTKKPEALVRALEECRGVYPGVEALTMEADDIAATLTLENEGMTILFSPDKDWSMLVGARCLQVIGGKVFDVAGITEKLGVPPHLIRNLLSFMGDKVDGLPGIPGYGPKRAIAKALAGEIGNQMTYELTELANVPRELMREIG